MDPLETGITDSCPLGFRRARIHCADKFLDDLRHQIAVRFGHRRKSEADRLAQAVLPAGAGDDVVEGLCRDYGRRALVLAEAADQLPAKIFLVAENAQASTG